jgi:uncharacterized oxidoreductase
MPIAAAALRTAVAGILTAAGSLPPEAQEVADQLVTANLKGHDSHGVGMIPTYLQSLKSGALVPNQHAEKVGGAGAIAVFDGHRGYGQVIANEAIDWAIAAVKTSGVAVTALRNTHHIGRVGAYGERAAAAGLVSLHFANVLTVAARVAPFGGREGRFGTNPICITFPQGSGNTPPIVLDFATSGIAAGKIRVAYNTGKELPPGMLLDNDGNPTTDPAIFIRDHGGAMLSFGGHKASGLAFACELLAGALTGSGVIRESALGKPGVRNGLLSILLDPACFGDVATMQEEVMGLSGWVRSSAPVPGVEQVLLAGEPERIANAKRQTDGIVIDPTTLNELRAGARSVGLGDEWIADKLKA